MSSRKYPYTLRNVPCRCFPDVAAADCGQELVHQGRHPVGELGREGRVDAHGLNGDEEERDGGGRDVRVDGAEEPESVGRTEGVDPSGSLFDGIQVMDDQEAARGPGVEDGIDDEDPVAGGQEVTEAEEVGAPLNDVDGGRELGVGPEGFGGVPPGAIVAGEGVAESDDDGITHDASACSRVGSAVLLGAAVGSRTVKVVPRPGSLSTVMTPWWRAMIP